MFHLLRYNELLKVSHGNIYIIIFKYMIETLKNWLGKTVDYDKAYGIQCVDLARQHALDMSNPIGTFSGSALNGWLT